MGVKTTYQTTDGQFFDTRADANRHQRLLDAKTALASLFFENTSLNQEQADEAAGLVIQAGDVVSKVLRGQTQPLEDESVFSDLGLLPPKTISADDDSEASSEEEGDQEETADKEDEDPAASNVEQPGEGSEEARSHVI